MRNAPPIIGPGARELLALAAVAAASATVLLTNLGLAPVQMWDESRLAINALEMMASSNPLIVTYHGEPDLWNTKPPLAAMLAALSMYLGGTNEMTLRLPAAIAAAATIFAVYYFTKSVSGARSTAVLAALILLGTGGYVESHVARTAEPDSLMILFLTLMTFSVARWIDLTGTDRGRGWLGVALASLTGAMLTKGVAALLVLPGCLIGLIATGKVEALRGRNIVLAAGSVALAALLYWGGRELAGPGYLTAVSATELGRYFEPLPGSAGPWYDYLIRLVWPWQATPFFGYDKFISTSSAFPWSVLAALLTPLLLSASEQRVRRAALFLSCCLLGFIFVVSASATKLAWYVAPAYPIIAVLSALGIAEIARRIQRSERSFAKRLGRYAVPGAFGAAVASMAFVIWKNEQVARVEAYSPQQRLGSFVRAISPFLDRDRPVRVISDPTVHTTSVRRGRIVGTEAYDGPAEFYVALLQRSGHDARIVTRDYEPDGAEVIAGCGPVPPRLADFTKRVTIGTCFAMSQNAGREREESR